LLLGEDSQALLLGLLIAFTPLHVTRAVTCIYFVSRPTGVSQPGQLDVKVFGRPLDAGHREDFAKSDDSRGSSARITFASSRPWLVTHTLLSPMASKTMVTFSHFNRRAVQRAQLAGPFRVAADVGLPSSPLNICLDSLVEAPEGVSERTY
jgi:hypothetical protein